MTAVAVGLIAHFVSGLPGPSAIVIGNGLALSSTAVVLQVSMYDLSALSLCISSCLQVFFLHLDNLMSHCVLCFGYFFARW